MIIDKVRIKYKLAKNSVIRYDLNLVDPLDFEVYGITNIKHKSLSMAEQCRIGAWREMFWFELADCESSFAFFYAQYGANFAWHYDICMVEYNPNKVRIPPPVVTFLSKYYAKVAEIVSLDVAFDFPNVPVSAFLFDCNGNNEVMTYGTVSSTPTRYLRPKANDGRVKIYDKGKEREGKADEKEYKGVTRVEVTYHNVGFLVLGVYNHDWGFHIMQRLKEMLDDLNSVKVPGVFKNVPSSGLNAAFCNALDSFLELDRTDKALEVISYMGINQRKQYRDYLSARREFHGVFDGNEIEFGLQLSDEVKKVLIA